MSDIPVLNLGFLLAASKQRQYRESVLESFRVLVEFLQERGLTTRELVPEGSQPPLDFLLFGSDLTEEGRMLVGRVVPRWFDWIEKGSPIADTSILDRGLKRIRADPTRYKPRGR